MDLSHEKSLVLKRNLNTRANGRGKEYALPVRHDEDNGPFDIIGDVHGCWDELRELLLQLGYEFEFSEEARIARHPSGRKAIYLGDLVNRGPRTGEVLRLVIDSVAAGTALAVPGNQDLKLLDALLRDPEVSDSSQQESIHQIQEVGPEFRKKVCLFLAGLPSHLLLDDGRLVAVHAGLPEEMHGSNSAEARNFAVHGALTGEIDSFESPVRWNWAAHYSGRTIVVYGHTPVAQPEWLHRTINIDTGCVYGGRLTALRYPEKELISVPARHLYWKRARPLS